MSYYHHETEKNWSSVEKDSFVPKKYLERYIDYRINSALDYRSERNTGWIISFIIIFIIIFSFIFTNIRNINNDIDDMTSSIRSNSKSLENLRYSIDGLESDLYY